MDYSQLFKPDWQHAATYTRINQPVVELLVDASSVKLDITLGNSAGGKPVFNKAYTRSSFLLLNNGTEYKAYIMTVIADSSYLKNDLTKLDHNKYNKRDADFSGAVIYSTPKGQFVSGWFYKNGSITGKIPYNKAGSANIGTGSKIAINGLKTNTLPCTDWFQMYYQNGILVDAIYLGSTGDCSDASPITTPAGGGTPGAPGNGNDTGTGTGSGHVAPPYDQYNPCATAHAVSPTKTVNSTKGVNTFNPEPPVSSDPGDGGFPPPEPPAPCVVVNPIILPLLDVSALSKYPKFKALASDLPNCLKKYPNITKALAYYTGFSEATILQLMEPGKGPKIVTVPDLKNSFGVSLYGKYDAETKTILINENFAKGFEVAQSETTIQATALLLAITTLHEFVHYGRDQNKLSDLFNGYEAGWTFEMNIDPSGTGINKNNAVKWINYYPYNFK